MCGRYSLTLPPEAVRQWFAYRGHPNVPARYNIAPTQEVPIIRSTAAEPEMVIARWGLVPSWAKEIGTKPLINARAEDIENRPSFRAAFHERRCLVPADGFYEWQIAGAGPKIPYRICRPDRSLFAMAGIYELWREPATKHWLISFAILTTGANKLLAPIHDRMPVILDDADRVAWIAPGAAAADLKRLLRPAAEGTLTAYAISKRVNQVANDDAAIIEPASSQAGPTSAAGKQMTLF